ncbi:hypothetical protein ACS0TY_002019 [Phlomoides rotata]
MSDLYMHECVDIAWDGFCLRDDHIVPDPGNKKVNGQDSEKKHRCEITSNSSNAGDRSACRCVEQKGCQGGISRLSKRRNTMLEKDSWSYKPDRAATSAFYSDPVKEASNLASDSTSANGLKSNHRNSNSGEFSGLDAILDDKTSIVYNNSFNYPMGGINHASNDINYFENAENKDSSDLIYCDWPEIENFEDIDRMLRNCDSTFGLGICKDESGWLSSNDTGGSGAVLKSDVKFSYLESGDVENISENHDFLNDYSINNMITAPITYKDSSRTSEKSESYRSFVIGPDIVDSKVGFIPQEEQITKSEFNNKIQPSISTDSHSRSGSAAVTIEHHSQIKQKKQSEGKGNEHYPGNYRFSHEFGKLSSGVTSVQPQQQHESSPDSCSYSKNPISYMQSDNSHSAGLSSLNLKLSIVQSETNDLTSVSPEESSHSSSQLQYMGDSPNPDFEATAVPICEQRKMLNCHQVNLSSVHDCQKDGSVTVQASMTDPGLRGKSESHCNAAELSSSNIQENSTMGPDLEDISLEAASFCQLQLVMKQLDLRTRLCIRDSLYRLARSAEQRHNLANMNAGCGEGDDETKRYTSFMDMETHTNPIDRSVAHLLFHRPSDSSTQPAQGSLPFQSSSAVIGSITGPPVLADNLVSEENVSQVILLSWC